MENKTQIPDLYYIPNVSHFYDGCEFYTKQSDDTVILRIFRIQMFDYLFTKTDNGDGNISYEIERSSILRMKFLDQSDIERLGWKEEIKDDGMVFHLRKDEDNTCILYFVNKQIFIRWTDWSRRSETAEASPYSEYIFTGTIRNYNELKTLMRQLGILSSPSSSQT